MGNKEINCSYTREITCPYCGVEHTDSWEYMDDGEIYCEECDNDFTYTRDYDISYCSEKIEQEG